MCKGRACVCLTRKQANVLTGLVNMNMDTIHTPKALAIVVITLYMAMVSAIVYNSAVRDAFLRISKAGTKFLALAMSMGEPFSESISPRKVSGEASLVRPAC